MATLVLTAGRTHFARTNSGHLSCSAGRTHFARTNIFHLVLRKCRKSEDKIKSNKLLEACLNNDKNIFDEIKNLRKCNTDVVNSIDGEA